MTDIGIAILAGLVGAGAMEATFTGGAVSRDDMGGYGSISGRTFFFFILSLAAFFFIGWWWIGFWAAIFGLKMIFMRGRTHSYEQEPDEVSHNYGQFSEIASRRTGSAPVPDDPRLKELIAEGKIDEARAHARDMKRAALEFGDPVKAARYERWLDG